MYWWNHSLYSYPLQHTKTLPSSSLSFPTPKPPLKADNPSPKRYVSFLNDNLNQKMYNLTKLKILVIGPEAVGKTAVVNYLSQKSNVLETPYRPTNPVRIVEH